MRIVVVSRFYWPDLGGAQAQLRMLAREWGRVGHDVTVLTCRWDPSWGAEERVENHRIIRWPVWRTRFVGRCDSSGRSMTGWLGIGTNTTW